MSDLSSLAAAATDERRFGGISRLYGADAARKILDSHIVVIGVGGVGSWAAEALARCGVGRLTLIDLDHVAESNINRQVHATDFTLGQAKVQAMRERLALIHPQANVNAIEEFVDADNASSLLPPDAQVYLEACDRPAAKAAVASVACNRSIACVMSGAAGGKRHAHCVQVADLAEVTHDPLLAAVRQRLRKEHGFRRSGAMGVQAVFSREAITRDAALDPDAGLACAGYGSSVNVTGSFGFTLAALALDAVLAAATPASAKPLPGEPL